MNPITTIYGYLLKLGANIKKKSIVTPNYYKFNQELDENRLAKVKLTDQKEPKSVKLIRQIFVNNSFD